METQETQATPATGTALAELKDSPGVKKYAQILSAPAILGRIEKMLPPGCELNGSRFVSIALQLLRSTPDLLECNQDSLINALYDAAQSGLPPDGVLGQCYLVPFKRQVQFILGYRGMITLAMNSGQVLEIAANEVRRGDHFDVVEGTTHSIVHKVDYKNGLKARGEIVAFYAIATLTRGGKVFEIMMKDEVDAIMEKSGGPAWKAYYSEMGKKTALRRLAKWLPQSVQRFTQAEEHFEAKGEVVNLNPGGYSEIEATATSEPNKVVDGGAAKVADAPGGRKASKGAQAAAGSTGAAVSPPPPPPSPPAAVSPPPPPPPATQQQAPAEQQQDRGQLAGGTEHRSPDGAETVIDEQGEVVEKQGDLSEITIDKVGRAIDLQGWLDKAKARLVTIESLGQWQTLKTNNARVLSTIASFDEDLGAEAERLFAERKAAIEAVPFG